MKPNTRVRQTLTAITAALVGATPANASGLDHSETSVLIYSERGRVHATEALYSLDKQLRGNDRFNLRLTYDGLTGASPTGGSPSKRPQTVTRPSGGGKVLVAAGELPINDGFSETRFAVDAGLTRRLSSNVTIRGEVHLSSEHDYRSIGISGGISRTLADAMTTLGAALTASYDVNSPLGGVPKPFDSNTTPIETRNGRRASYGNEHKNAYDAVFSLTRVLGPTTRARVSYRFAHARGYLTDPYKVISVVQPADSADAGEPINELYESRPSRRTGHALSCDLRKYVMGLTTEVTYRYYRDDWSIRSHTVGLSFNVDARRIGTFEPHVRWYHQERASFSKPFLLQGMSLPKYASTDSRLAAFDALTYGLAYSIATSLSSRLTLACEFYSQHGDRSPPESFGPLLAYNLFPDLNAVLLKIGLSHDF